MCCFVILLLSYEMQMSVRHFSAIPHLGALLVGFLVNRKLKFREFCSLCMNVLGFQHGFTFLSVGEMRDYLGKDY